jgi:ketosteroid isomerase-like protein
VNDAKTFVEVWSTVWDGSNSDPDRYMEILHEGCRLINPVMVGTREDLPQIMQAFLELEPDVRVVATRTSETDDSVLIEWRNTGTLRGKPFELRGTDCYALRDGKGIEGYSYFDPRPFLSGPAADE